MTLRAWWCRRVYRQIRKLRVTIERRMGGTRESPVGQTFDVCGAKITVREQLGGVLLVDVLPPRCPTQFIIVNVPVDPPTSRPDL